MTKYSILFNYVLLSLAVVCYGISDGLFDRLNCFPLLQSKKNPPNPEDNHPAVNHVEHIRKKKEMFIPDIEKVVKYYGYPFEKHEVITEDGYILGLMRVKHGRNGHDMDGTIRKPVMLQHGITDSALSYLIRPECLAYYLADRGYDVWIGNNRGNPFSRKHVDEDKDPDKEDTTFWDFGFHEIGVYDLPAYFKTIRKNTGGNKKIHYVGNSMGSTVFLVMASEHPEYLEMIDCVILTAPVARLSKVPLGSTTLKNNLYWGAVHTWRMISKKTGTRFYQSIPADNIRNYCISKGLKPENCEKLIKGIQGLIDTTELKYALNIFEDSPMSESANSYVHFLQIQADGKFQKFDYGTKGNIDKYGQERPPEYNLKNINKKLYLMLGGEDTLAKPEDVQWLHGALPSSELIADELKDFGHQDFYFGEKAEKILFKIILKIFTKWESEEAEKLLEEKNE